LIAETGPCCPDRPAYFSQIDLKSAAPPAPSLCRYTREWSGSPGPRPDRDEVSLCGFSRRGGMLRERIALRGGSRSPATGFKTRGGETTRSGLSSLARLPGVDLPRSSSPPSSSSWSFKVSGTAELRPAVKSSNTSSAFTIANGGTRRSVTCVLMNSNDAIMNRWLLNPSVHAIGATSELRRYL